MSRAVGLASCAALLIVGGSCHGTGDPQPLAGLSRITPAKVSTAEAWRLFDRSLSSGFAPGSEPVGLDLGQRQQIVAFKVHGASPYVVELTGTNGTSLGFAPVNLSQLSPGWHMLRSESPRVTDHVELRFRPVGAAAQIPELELWGLEEQHPGGGSSSAALSSFAATEATKQLEPGDCASFAVNVDRSPGVFRRIDLAYDAVGVVRTFAIERSIQRSRTDRWCLARRRRESGALVRRADRSESGPARQQRRSSLPAERGESGGHDQQASLGQHTRSRNVPRDSRNAARSPRCRCARRRRPRHDRHPRRWRAGDSRLRPARRARCGRPGCGRDPFCGRLHREEWSRASDDGRRRG